MATDSALPNEAFEENRNKDTKEEKKVKKKASKHKG
jgi:hypothetical protein